MVYPIEIECVLAVVSRTRSKPMKTPVKTARNRPIPQSIRFSGLVWVSVLLTLGLFPGCGLNRDHDFGNGPSTFDSTITALKQMDSSRPVDTLRVGSLNMSIGFPVSQLLFLDVTIDSVAYKSLDTIATRWRRGRPDDRIRLMAQAIVTHKLDVVGLQEVLVFTLNDSTPHDFYNLLKAELERLTQTPWHGMRRVLNDTLLQATWAGRSLKVRFAEGNALLVRDGFSISDSGSTSYQSLLPIQIEGAKPTERGFNHARITGRLGSQWSIYNTHLEVLEPYRSTQAAELVKEMTGQRKWNVAQVAIGDFNDAPKTGSTQIIGESGMLDSRELVKVGPVGTCCVDDSRLWDDKAGFSNRTLDYVFVHHVLGALTWNRGWEGALPMPDGSMLWPSDHILVTTTLISQ
jgi:endonuclease/exonuclease/phosphatase family metal-dependent hydrolase